MKKSGQRASYYPIFLNIRGKKCVVVGGGKVAFRKVKALLEHGANVEVISPDLCPELRELAKAKAISVLRQNYEPENLKGAFIAIAATNEKDINQRVIEEAKKQGVLVNVVDNLELSDFIVPSHFHRGDLTIAVSTAGLSPALARKIRSQLEQNFREEYASLTTLIDEVRTELKQKGIIINGNTWQEALDLDLLLKLLHAGLREQAKVTLLDRLERLR